MKQFNNSSTYFFFLIRLFTENIHNFSHEQYVAHLQKRSNSTKISLRGQSEIIKKLKHIYNTLHQKFNS